MGEVSALKGCLNLLERLISEKENPCDCRNSVSMQRERELLKQGRKSLIVPEQDNGTYFKGGKL